MGKKTPTRREIDKTNFENERDGQAINTLTEAGLLIKMNDIELYHGRSGDKGEWRVRPEFNNAGNNTGNSNINKISALNTSNHNTANEFAVRRAQSNGGTPEVHRILSDDPDARIIYAYFSFSNLNQDKQREVLSAIRSTLPGITSGAPLDFAYRDALRHISPRDFKSSDYTGFIYDEDVDNNAKRLHLDKDLNRKIISTRNTMQLLGNYPQLIQKLLFAYIDNEPDIELNNRGEFHSLPVNHEYLSNWLRKIHAVGCRVEANSATLGHKMIENYLLFDLEKINTASELQRKNEIRMRRFGKIALAMEKRHSHGNLAQALTDDLYIEPQEVLALAKQTAGYKEVYEADAGNWEKFTLEEHTETTLRLFDNNYADLLPASVLPIMRLALLVHDIGKPEAAKNHDKENQKTYNVKTAEAFMVKNNIDPANRKLITKMIGDGLEYTTRWMIKREQGLDSKFYAFCEQTMKEYLGTNAVDSSTVTGFRNLLEVLQTCDSAAYTTMAVTRSAKDGIFYRNYGSFNNSFEPFHGLSGNRVKLK